MPMYVWGIATPFLIAYIAFGLFLAVQNWQVRPTDHWRHQYERPCVKAPLFVRNWTVFWLLLIATPLLWPITTLIGKALMWRYRAVASKHVTGAQMNQRR